jgi:hypothetical protein
VDKRLIKDILKPWELILAIVILFLVCSTSLFWYDYFDKTTKHTIEMENKAKWERDTMKWQSTVTANINSLKESQQQVLDVINLNISTGRLVMPQKEKK